MGLLVPHEPSRVLSSPYLRAVQTVLPTAAALGLPVERREALREWHSGIGATPDWEPHYRYCWENPDWAAGTGETHRELEARALAAVQQAAAEAPAGSVTVLGSHGTWIARALHGLGCDVDAAFWLDMPKPAVYEVVLGAGAPAVRGPGIDGPRS